MKLLKLKNSIISLENFRSARVINLSDNIYTSNGSYHATIVICYQCESKEEYIYIDKKTETEREKTIQSLLNEIVEILQND